jgi:hypothetical protein
MSEPEAHQSSPGSPWQWAYQKWQKEKRVVKGAPISFCICLLIVTVFLVIPAVWWLENSHYAGIIEAQQATILEKDATIQNVSSNTGLDAAKLVKFMSQLPTTPPSGPNQLWLNGGTVCISGT